MTNYNKNNKKLKADARNSKSVYLNDAPITEQKVFTDAIMRFAVNLSPAQRKKFSDTFNTLYIEEG